MRTRFFWAALLVLLVAGSSAAQTNISGTVQNAKADPAYSIEIGDHPGHATVLQKTTCTWTTSMEIAGAKSKDGYDVTTVEMWATRSSSNGTHVSTMDNGDKFFVTFHGASAVKDGKPGPEQGTWSFTGGTGKLKGLKGKGTYKGTSNEDGTTNVEVKGEYELPAAKTK